MERHNNIEKYEKYIKILIGLYLMSGVAIVLLPFLQSNKGYNILGFHSPYTFVFAAFAVIGLVMSVIRIYKNNECRDGADVKKFNYQYPLIVAAISLVIFLFAGDFFVEAWKEKNEMTLYYILWEKVNGAVEKLAFWWGPFVYCACMAAAGYFSVLLNNVTNEIRKGQK